MTLNGLTRKVSGAIYVYCTKLYIYAKVKREQQERVAALTLYAHMICDVWLWSGGGCVTIVNTNHTWSHSARTRNNITTYINRRLSSFFVVLYVNQEVLYIYIFTDNDAGSLCSTIVNSTSSDDNEARYLYINECVVRQTSHIRFNWI